MAYNLDQFCADAHTAIAAEPGTPGREKVRGLLKKLLAHAAFIAEHLGPDLEFGVQTLYQDPEFGFRVLAHANRPNRDNTPHDHGSTWAVYGQAMNHTEMTVWRRTDDGSGDGPEDGHAELEQVDSYRLETGQAALYDSGVIHSLLRPLETRLVRVTTKTDS